MRNLTLLLVSVLILFNACKKDDPEPNNTEEATYDHQQEVGKSNADIVSSTSYNTLRIEVQFMPNHQPKTASLNNLESFVTSLVDKPNGVIITQSQINPSSAATYSLTAIKQIEKDYRTYKTTDDTLCVYFLFLDGEYAENTSNSKVLGAAYYNTSMVIFENTIKELSGGLGEPSREILETTVINHEFGHILGLVNNHLSMVSNHQDTDHGHHCDNQDCLMYYTAETGDELSNLIGLSSAPGLDQNCLNDVAQLK